MSIIRNILVRVGADSRPLDKGLNDASKSLNNFSASQKKALYAMNANMKSLMAESKKSSSGIGEVFKQSSFVSSVAFVALGSAVADASAQMLASVKSFVSGGLAAFNSFEASNIGLESIVTGMGRDLGKAKSFIQAYIKDGLVPLSDATTSYKQLVSRGYSDVQIQDILMRFKDSAAFARQGSLSMGEAIKGATEGLKNENSVLVNYLPSHTAMMAA